MNQRDLAKKRIKECRKKRELTQEQVAKYCSVTKATVSLWESLGEKGTLPSGPSLTKLTSLLKVSAGYLLGEIKLDENINQVNERPKSYIDDLKLIPFLSHSDLPAWVSSDDYQSFTKITRASFATTYPVTEKAFCIQMEGDSMLSPYDSQSIKPGVYLICDHIKPFSGDVVVGIFNKTGAVTVRKYISEANKSFLMPINQIYGVTELDQDVKICGVLIEIVERRRF